MKIATQDKRLQYELVVSDKAERVYKFHRKTVEAAMDLVLASGHVHPRKLSSGLIHIRGPNHIALTYAQLYPPLQSGELLTGGGAQGVGLKEAWDKGLKKFKAVKQIYIYKFTFIAGWRGTRPR